MSQKKNKTTQYNLLLQYGTRLDNHHYLPEGIKEGLKEIARSERKSVSRILEEALIDYFGLKKPKYKPRKRND